MAIRIYELAKETGLSSKELIRILNEHGFEHQSHMSILSDQEKKIIEQSLKASQESPLQEKKVSESSRGEARASHSLDQNQVNFSRSGVISEKGILVAPMTVSDFSEKAQKSVSDVILTLLKQGIVATKNQLISEKIVSQLAASYGLKALESVKKQEEVAPAEVASVVAEGKRVERLPVVVVVGHVDHGKTTLLDFIRKTRVAAKEKGGITQHLGAYEAETSHGNIVFLDTPGHEAFSLIRVRGLRVADIAILIVAADDGIMPQTIEAIKAAQAVGLPLIVAINKVDKATPQQIENVKRGLAQYNLIPEDWGGQTVCMPISAKTGQGIAELLDVVVLQSQLMELTARIDIPARGFVLESKFEKGLGPVATIICQHGVLRVGDYFIAGSTQGKVSSMINSIGQRVQSAQPSIPVLVAGFDALPAAGDSFEAVSAQELKRARSERSSEGRMSHVRQGTARENALNIIIKTDNVSSREALLGAIAKMSGKGFKDFHVVHAGVGAVSESDIMLAADTGSFIYGLHVKVEPNAMLLAQKQGILIKLFDIIYKLLEDLEVVAEQGRPVKKVIKKIGEAIVLKVFDIKSLGVIAGAQVKSGRFTRDGKVVVWRGKHKIGEGPIKSLQRDKKTVKEVLAGFECAFMVEDFIDWQVDDRVECFAEIMES